jgi:hypothetical protein
MSGNLLHANATITCPHGGRVQVLPAQTRVLVSGQPAATLADVFTIVGCPFTAGNKPQPCVTVSWLSSAAQVVVSGTPALPQFATAQCRSAEGIPQGPPAVSVVQQRVMGR